MNNFENNIDLHAHQYLCTYVIVEYEKIINLSHYKNKLGSLHRKFDINKPNTCVQHHVLPTLYTIECCFAFTTMFNEL